MALIFIFFFATRNILQRNKSQTIFGRKHKAAINFSQSTIDLKYRYAHGIAALNVARVFMHICNVRSPPKSRCCLTGYKYSTTRTLHKTFDRPLREKRSDSRWKKRETKTGRERVRGEGGGDCDTTSIQMIIFFTPCKVTVPPIQRRQRGGEYGSPSNCFSFHCPGSVEQRVDRNVQSAGFERPWWT